MSQKSKVYFTKIISPEKLIEVHNKLDTKSQWISKSKNYLRKTQKIIRRTLLDKNAFKDSIYDSFLVLAHFKGHGMGEFEEALKQLNIHFGSIFDLILM